jgi:hypothetical protein
MASMSLGDAVPFGRAEQRVGLYGSIKVLHLSRASNMRYKGAAPLNRIGRALLNWVVRLG